jgi:hypothetical protein
MAQVVEYQIKGTSDVPQQTEKAKKAMSEMEKQTAAIGKKFTEIGKDLFMGFLAPMVLIREAIGFISQSIEKARQDAKDAVDFAAGIKFEDVNKSPVDQTTRYMAQKLQVDIRTEEEQKKAELAKRVVTEEFLKRDPRGQEYYMRNAGVNIETGAPAISESNLAMLKRVQEDVFKIVQEDMKKALAAEKAKTEEEKKKSATPPGVFTGDNSVFGIGNSPQMNILNAQVELQKQANEYLAVIAASAGGPGDFTKDQTGGMASQVNYKDYTKTV